MSKNGIFSNLTNLGMAVAFNSLKNGSLSYLDISYCGINIDQLKNFIKGLKISENEHYKWYGYQFNNNILVTADNCSNRLYFNMWNYYR